MQFLILSLLGLGVASSFWGGKDDETAVTVDGTEDSPEEQSETPIVPLEEILSDNESLSEDDSSTDDDFADLIIARHGASETGSDESDNMLSSFGGICHGGEGDDTISVRNGGIAFGDAGDDLFEVSGASTVDGGDGDDLFLVDLEDGGENELTGGAGSDQFYISTADGSNQIEDQMTTITDFSPGEDRLVISAGVENSTLRAFEIQPSEDGLYVDVVLEMDSQISTDGSPAFHTIRLEGLADLSENDIQITLDDLEDTDIDASIEEIPISSIAPEIVTGTSEVDRIEVKDESANVLFGTGQGEDTVESDADYARGTLGEGDDVFIGSRGDLWVAGDAGNDNLFAAEGSLAHLDGGTGDDSLTAEADDQADSLIGGAGDDTLSGGVGDFMDAGPGIDQIVLNVTADGIGQEPAIITGLGNNTGSTEQQDGGVVANETLVLNISEEIRGELTFSDVTVGSGHSVEVVGTNVFLGEDLIAYIHEYGGEDGVGWRPSDPRLVVNWV